jgi:predicted N-acetyltransferase YhbS
VRTVRLDEIQSDAEQDDDDDDRGVDLIAQRAGHDGGQEQNHHQRVREQGQCLDDEVVALDRRRVVGAILRQAPAGLLARQALGRRV